MDNHIESILGEGWGVRHRHNTFYLHWWGQGKKTAQEYKEAWDQVQMGDPRPPVPVLLPLWVSYELAGPEEQAELNTVMEQLNELFRRLL